MAYRVPKSKTAAFPDFGAAVATFADDLNAWRTHMEKTKTDPKYHPYPAPQAHPEIMAALRETEKGFVPDFEIEDDGPSPELILRAKKNALAGELSRMELELVQAISPPGKRRLQTHRENDIRLADAMRRDRLLAQDHEKQEKHVGVLKKLKNLATGEGPAPQRALDDIMQEVEKRRPSEDTAFLQEQEELRQKIAAIDRHFAEQHHQVEDLTLETVDDWKPTPFAKET
jgi:hypothetical protein